MNIEEEFKKFLHEWVKKNFGQSEADDPSWSIEALAHDLRDEYIKIKEREDLEWYKSICYQKRIARCTPKISCILFSERKRKENNCGREIDTYWGNL